VALDRDFRFTYVNRRVLEQTGKTREELLGRNVWEVFPEASETDLLPLYRKVMEERVPAQFQLHFRGRWLEVHAHPAPDGLSAYIMDVTERRQAQDAVRESEKRARRQWLELETVYKTAPVGLALADADLRYVRVNEQLAVINGLPVEEHPGKRIRDVATPIAAVVEGLHREVIETGRPIMAREIECPCPAQPNSPRSFLVSLVPLRFDGAVAGVSSAIQDVTEQRSFERQIRQTQKLEAIGVLAGGVAHDFNNLLTGIMGNASLAMEAIAASHPSYEPLTETLRAAERASALTMQLLAYSGKGRFVVETINLSELIREITSLVRSSIPRTVDLQLDLADPIAEINADPAQIQQLILNLVINAAEAVPPEHPGVVRISTSEMELAGSHPGFPNQPPAFGRHVLLEVSDSGVGMDDATKARIFDPFFTTKFTGRGLGLAAALGIVRGHKGMISVESRPGAGSTFRVVLPATGQAERAGPKTAGVSRPQGTGTILVVDDEEVVLRMASAALKRTGYDVLVAHNGEAAVEVFRRAGPVSAVLLDLTMPIMGGEETLRRLRMISPHVKVILSSGFSEMEALRRFQGKGLDGFIQKPYTAATLATKLQQVLLGRGLPAAGAA
jgi:PAS domain S-box-containing protein